MKIILAILTLFAFESYSVAAAPSAVSINLSCDYLFSEAPTVAPLDEIKVPQVKVFTKKPNRGFSLSDYFYERIDPMAADHMLSRPVEEIVRFASKQMARRGWSLNFLIDGRLDVAKKYSSRSAYIRVNQGPNWSKWDDNRQNDLVATAGVTWAEYKLGDSHLQQLPVEETLSLSTKLPRPVDSKGNGLIIELRTYGKDKEKDNYAFPVLLQGILDLAFDVTRKYPELYKEQILYLYGDALSIRFYEGFGFEVYPDIPAVEYEGTSWKVMRASPQKLEKVIYKLKGRRYFENFNQAYQGKLEFGGLATLVPQKRFAVDENDNLTRGTLQGNTELAKGVWAAAGAEFEVRDNGSRYNPKTGIFEVARVMSISKIANPLAFAELKFIIPAGSAVEIYLDGHVQAVTNISQSVQIPILQNITVNKGGMIAVFNEGEHMSDVNARRAPYYTQISTTRSSGRAQLQTGLIPDNAGIYWTKLLDDTEYSIFYVSRIASDYEHVKRGEAVYQFRNGQVLTRKQTFTGFGFPNWIKGPRQQEDRGPTPAW